MLETAPSIGTSPAAISRSKSSTVRWPAWASAPCVLLLLLVWLGATGWFRQLTLPDEGRYVGVAWEMVRSGNWAVPTLDGLPFFHKPPLFYWMAAASMTVFGPNEWAARLPSLIGATGAAWALFLFVRRWIDARAAAAALVVLATSPGYFAAAQFANHDMLVASWIAAAILLCAHAILSADMRRPYRLTLFGAYACAALGVLTKGLIGAVLPFLVVACWTLIARRPKAMLLLFWPPGLVLFGAISLPWFATMQGKYAGFLDYAFIEQQFKRFAQGGFNNQQPWWFYLPVLGLLTLPWIVQLPRALHRAMRADKDPGNIRMLMWVWILVVLLFFSLPGSKLIGYILPALPPLSFVLAENLLRAFRGRPGARSSAPLMVGLGAAACLATVFGVGIFGAVSAKPLATSLRPLIAADDRILMLDRYVYDAPFYLRLSKPSLIASSWRDPEINSSDNWRREIFDASLFDPLLSRQVLVESDQIGPVLCKPGTTWIFGDANSVARFPWLARAVQASQTPRLTVWRWDLADLDIERCLKAFAPAGT